MMTMKKRLTHRNFFLATSLFGLAVLSGCANTRPPVTNQISPEQIALNKSIAQIAAVSKSLRTASEPYKGFPLPQTGASSANMCHGLQPDSPLAQRLSVQWSGKTSTLLEGMAARWGWSFENNLGHAHDPDVAIYTKKKPAADILAQIASETPSNIVISVMPGVISLGVRK